jgi:hypothetical protein
MTDQGNAAGWRALMTLERWIEVGRIALNGILNVGDSS